MMNRSYNLFSTGISAFSEQDPIYIPEKRNPVVFNRSAESLQKVEENVEALKMENQELKARLAKAQADLDKMTKYANQIANELESLVPVILARNQIEVLVGDAKEPRAPAVHANGHSGEIDLDALTPAPVEEKALPTPEGLKKLRSRILAGVPNETTNNSIASLINFCNHFLNTEVNFRAFEDGQLWHVTVQIGGKDLGDAKSGTKSEAKRIACYKSIAMLNNDLNLLNGLVEKRLASEQIQ